MQTNEETTSDPPGIDDTGSNELQLNHINCEASDTESDTDNTISVNMITVENDYEPIIYEQLFTSHIYMKINWNSFTITILDPLIPHKLHKK